MDPAIAALGNWDNFYVIVGSSAGALIGLMFVVVTLIADAKQPRSLTEINAFATPAVVHFAAVLVIAAILAAPWPDIHLAADALGLVALAGIGYMIIVLRRLLRPTQYRPVAEDWIWHAVLPFLAYIGLLVAHLGLSHHQVWALFAVAGAALLLLFVGIHNAWDAVTYMVVTRKGS